jgi:hypothetical protein
MLSLIMLCDSHKIGGRLLPIGDPIHRGRLGCEFLAELCRKWTRFLLRLGLSKNDVTPTNTMGDETSRRPKCWLVKWKPLTITDSMAARSRAGYAPQRAHILIVFFPAPPDR